MEVTEVNGNMKHSGFHTFCFLGLEEEAGGKEGGLLIMALHLWTLPTGMLLATSPYQTHLQHFKHCLVLAGIKICYNSSQSENSQLFSYLLDAQNATLVQETQAGS